MRPPVFGVIGWKNSGKTTLMAKLVEEFTKRGYVVSAIKHAHHSFDIDHEGRDTYKLREAGARQVAIASPRRWAVMSELGEEDEPSFEEMLSLIGPCDLVLVEGYKSGQFPKIEARSTRSLTRSAISDQDPNIIAVATSEIGDSQELPVLNIDDVPAIAEFIIKYLDLKPKSN
jgi:molybdopterin-guanine dinucleotide biosynthesis protein B